MRIDQINFQVQHSPFANESAFCNLLSAMHSTSVISAVVLAAGASTRMGRQKLLLPLGGEPLVRRTVRQVSEAGFDDLLVLVGCDHDQILGALDGLRCRHVINAEYATGMGSSFRSAVGELADSAAAMFA